MPYQEGMAGALFKFGQFLWKSVYFVSSSTFEHVEHCKILCCTQVVIVNEKLSSEGAVIGFHTYGGVYDSSYGQQ